MGSFMTHGLTIGGSTDLCVVLGKRMGMIISFDSIRFDGRWLFDGRLHHSLQVETLERKVAEARKEEERLENKLREMEMKQRIGW